MAGNRYLQDGIETKLTGKQPLASAVQFAAREKLQAPRHFTSRHQIGSPIDSLRGHDEMTNPSTLSKIGAELAKALDIIVMAQRCGSQRLYINELQSERSRKTISSTGAILELILCITAYDDSYATKLHQHSHLKAAPAGSQ